MITYYNPEAFKKLKQDSKIAPHGFRYGFVTGVFHEDVYKDLIKTFPDVKKFTLVDKQSGGGHKRFYVGPSYYSGKDWGSTRHLKNLPAVWKGVIRESGSPEFVAMVQEATGVKCNSLCNFGFTYGNEGCVQGPHIDGAARPDDPNPIHATIACLMYFNEQPGGFGGTEVYDTDRTTVIARVADLRNSFFYFEQHPDSWHGFPKMPAGADRRLVSLSFSQEPKPLLVTESVFHPHYLKTQLKKAVKRVVRR